MTRGLETYDRAFYESHYNKQSVDDFLKFAQETKKFIETKRLPLHLKFNKNYCSFKHGFFNVFGIMWLSSKTFAYFFKLPKSIAERVQPDGLRMDRYDDGWKQAVYMVDSSKSKVKTFWPLFENAFNSVTGKTG